MIQANKVEIGKHAIIGTGSVILPGVKVGEAAAVGALSLVIKSLADWGIFAGIPAKQIGERSKIILEKEKEYSDWKNKLS